MDQVGVDQNFLSSEWHSLLALQMIARIGRIFQVKLQVRSVFEEPTIEGLAVELEKAQALGLKAFSLILLCHAASANSCQPRSYLVAAR